MADLPLECRLLDCHTPSLPMGEEVGRDDDDDLFRTRATEVVSPALSADNDVSILEAAYSSYDDPNGQGNDLVLFAATTSLSHSDNFENNNNNNYNLPCWYFPPSTTAATTQHHHHTRSPPQFLKSTSLTISSVLLLHDEDRLNSEAEAEAMLHRLQTQQPRHALVRDDHHEDVYTTSDIENAVMPPNAHCNASSPACRATTAAAAARPRSSSPSKLCRQHCEAIRRPCTTSCNPPTQQSLPDSASSLGVHARLVQSETSCSIASPDE